MQNLVVVSQTARSQEFGVRLGLSLGRGEADAPEILPSFCVIIRNFVALGQTVCAHV